jgi:DNA-binding transcriptional regulator of glucitol operon
VLVHLAATVLIVTFLLLGWWQVGRAASGNLLSYGYAIQWPAFAAFVAFVWIKEIRRVVTGPGAATPGPGAATPGLGAATPGPGAATPGRGPVSSGPGSPATAATMDHGAAVASRPVRARTRSSAYDDSDDPELAAYNHYLAWRNANPHASRSDYPGPST